MSDMKAVELLVVAILVTGAHSQCQYQSFLINANNVEDLASFMDNTITVDQMQRTISFGAGPVQRVRLLEIPLVAAGELDPDTVIRMTVALNPPSNPTTDHFPVIGITDGNRVNRIILPAGSFPCRPANIFGGVTIGSHDDNPRPANNTVPYAYTLLFKPANRYEACETAEGGLGGYVNTMTFEHQVDPSNGLNFILYRSGDTEQYTFYYFLIELLLPMN